jgi:hypothetical protein
MCLPVKIPVKQQNSPESCWFLLYIFAIYSLIFDLIYGIILPQLKKEFWAMQKGDAKMKEIQLKTICNRKFEIGNSLSVNPVIPSKNKTIDNLSFLITCVPVFLSTCPFLYRFGTCLVRVSYRFVSISIGIFPYVFVPQTSIPNQKRGFSPFPDF